MDASMLVMVRQQWLEARSAVKRLDVQSKVAGAGLCLLLSFSQQGLAVELTQATQDEDGKDAKLGKITVTDGQADQNLSEVGFNVDTINTEEFLNSSKDINQLINSSPGVIIRENGGLGSKFKLSLNGLSENQVRYFIDDIPMESFGSALTLDNFPVNLIKSIEIYKGVVPVSLGADALGGAINITTPALDEDFIDVAYSIGSFNTQRASLFSHNSDDQGRFLRISSFYNSSDNDYYMDDVLSTDENGNVTGTERVKRFHDEYWSGMFSIKSGIANTDLADELSFNVTYAENRNNEQHPDTSINNVYGGLHTRNNTLLASVTYKETYGNLKLKSYLLAGEITETLYDTESRDYEWDGSYTDIGGSQGELENLSIFERKDEVIRSNISLDYAVNDTDLLSANLSINDLSRSGHDEIDEFNDLFSDTNEMTKVVLGGAYQSNSTNEKLSINTFAKLYWFDAKINTNPFDDNVDEVLKFKSSESETGYGATANYVLSSNAQVKASYEKAFRLPEADEILGSSTYITPNPELVPEESHNINLGVSLANTLNDIYFNSEINAFYREADDFIKYNNDGGIKGQYENLGSVRIQGLETSLSLLTSDFYSLSVNATYQDMTDQTRITSDGTVNDLYGDRLTNEPYLFANLRGGAKFNTPSYNEINVYWTTNYVHSYFLLPESLGDPSSKANIPSQLTHDVDIDYSFATGKYNVALTINNLFDEAVFDNFNIQKPGRAFYLKFRYFN
jgi:outer membrane cobalamin receptor